MKECVLSTRLRGTGNLLLRLTIAVAIWPHGAQKMLGWFGGPGFSATYDQFTEQMGIWGPMALVAMLTEFLAPVFLVAGLCTRLASLFLAILMGVAMQYHLPNGFFINWGGTQAGEGVEYHILFIGAALSLMLLGAGKYSIDRLIKHKICTRYNCGCVAESPDFR